MSDFFQVEMGVLSKYVTTLRDAHQQLADLPKLLSGNDTQLGNDKLNSAAEDFQTSWEQGSKELGKAVDETTTAVQQVQGLYSGADQAIGDAVDKLKEPLVLINQFSSGFTPAGH
ncbi:hypothetical protein GCM10010435_52250 [Winogradskya consettensis]|uniref:Uncharacterized protein n=1 Tax=Winogradskya consettensis TaxID=113560 RepID=A0A919SIY1_9ACTN|nr:hypothetical protein [Actinoplanes consettensis]GIM71813.1 hypothetical protein Aco04nite_27190 [Actinoplanes consettensis]